MKPILPIVFFVLLTGIVKGQNTVNWRWARSDVGAAVSINPSYLKQVVAVRAYRTLWGELVNKKMTYGQSAYGDYKIVVLDSSGQPTDSTLIAGNVSLIDAQADAAGNWYIMGTYYDTVTIGNSAPVVRQPLGTSSMHFMCRLHNGSLAPDWFQVLGGDYTCQAHSFTLSRNDVFVPIDSYAATRICRIDGATGSRSTLWTQTYSATSSIQVDSMGNIYLAGSCPISGSIDFNGHLATVPGSIGLYPAYIVRYKAGGQYDWHYWMRDITCTARKLTLCGNNVIYYSGPINDSLVIDTFQVHEPRWVYDYLITRLDSSGRFHWVRQLKDTLGGDATVENAFHAVPGPDTSLLVAASTRGYIDWGNGVTSNVPLGTHASVMQFAADGKAKWFKYVAAAYSSVQHIASDGNYIVVTGTGSDSSAIYFDTLASPAVISAYSPFVAQLRIPDAPSGLEEISQAPGLKVYPNPAGDRLYIGGLEALKGEAVLSLFDITGRLQYQTTISRNTMIKAIDLSAMARGLYIVEVSNPQVRFKKKVLLR